MIEYDSKVVIDAILIEVSLWPWDATGVVEATQDVARKVPRIYFAFVYREANEPANY